MLINYYNITEEEILDIRRRARENANLKVKRIFEGLMKEGRVLLPLVVTPSFGFSTFTRFITTSIITSLASELNLNCISTPVILTVPKISDRVLDSVLENKVHPLVTNLVAFELTLPDESSLKDMLGENLEPIIRRFPQYVWSNLKVSATIPYNFEMRNEEFKKAVESQVENIHIVSEITRLIEDSLDRAFSDGELSYPFSIYRELGIEIPRDKREKMLVDFTKRILPRRALEEFFKRLIEIGRSNEFEELISSFLK